MKDLALEITRYIYEYLENVDCSCSYDLFGTCWYHLSDDDRIEWLSHEVEKKLNEHSRNL